MNGYQPKKTCNSCKKCMFCDKADNGKKACEKYEEFLLLPPKILPAPPKKDNEAKQRTVLSVRDFVILYEIANRRLEEIERNILCMGMDREEVNHNPYY